MTAVAMAAVSTGGMRHHMKPPLHQAVLVHGVAAVMMAVPAPATVVLAVPATAAVGTTVAMVCSIRASSATPARKYLYLQTMWRQP